MKKSFTLLELVFVIVVIGIIALAVIPRINSNKLQQAAIQLVSHIRYTQHLAMVDDKYKVNDFWFKERWQLVFQMQTSHTYGKYTYTIFSDRDSVKGKPPNSKPDITNDEIAIDPLNKEKFLSGGTHSLYTSDVRANKKMNLGLSYGIDSYSLSGGCSSVRISFDHLGRPISDDLNDYTSSYMNGSKKLIHSTCIITLNSSKEGSIEIHIEPETGYAHIVKI
jgi:type II secretory pathway pseudopilin PulG